MRVLLTSAGLETEEIKDCFLKMLEKDVSEVKALFIPTAAIDAGAIAVLPKCMNDLLKCGIRNENIRVFDLHTGMEITELQKFDVVYLCGGNTAYLLERVNTTRFNVTLMEYIKRNGMVIGVSAGSLIFANNLAGNLGLINTRLDVHCPDGEARGKVEYPLKRNIRLTNTSAFVIRDFPDGLEVIGEYEYDMYRLGIIEESIENKDVFGDLTPYFVSQRIENVPKDECPVWHVNEYHVPDDRIMGIADMLKRHMKENWYCHAFSDEKLLVVLKEKWFEISLVRDETWDEMIEYGVRNAKVERTYLETIPLHI